MKAGAGATLALLIASANLSSADDVLYRYEGNVVPYDKSAGWEIFNPCEPPCGESVEKGRFVLRWTRPADAVNYQLTIATKPEKPPPTLWVEWRFRSNRALGPNFYTCDAKFKLQYASVFDVVFMYADAAISFSGDDFIGGLEVDEFHTYRFESIDGENYWIAVDGKVFIVGVDSIPRTAHAIALRGGGGCDRPELATVNEWDFVRYGTISFGERVIASDPPEGFLDARKHAALDRFTVTFDSPNYVYIDDIDVSTSGGGTPVVTQTWRRENDEPDTLEIVLDQPIPPDQRTVFTINDGEAINTVAYTFIHGDADADGNIDLHDFARMQTCFAQSPPTSTCQAFDFDNNNTIDLTDFSQFQSTMTGLIP